MPLTESGLCPLRSLALTTWLLVAGAAFHLSACRGSPEHSGGEHAAVPEQPATQPAGPSGNAHGEALAAQPDQGRKGASAETTHEEHTTEDASTAVQKYLDARVKSEGSFRFKDVRADEQLELVEDQIRVARGIHGYGFFVCAEFHAKADAQKPYDIDFWLAEDTLQLVDIRIHKAPKRDAKQWLLATRNPLLWWWIPASEHPGEFEEKRGWQLESVINEYVAARTKDGVFTVKDDKTGEERSLEFVEIHRPTRKMEGKGYFACTDFRERDSPNKYYDLDFWIADKQGVLQVTDVRIHKEPRQVDGNWIQMSRYTYEKDATKEIP